LDHIEWFGFLTNLIHFDKGYELFQSCIKKAPNYSSEKEVNFNHHKKYIIKRETENYDGGAKSSDFKQVLGSRAYFKKIAHKHKAPIFTSIEAAVSYLENKYKAKL
jgi:hypothetical protein